MFDKNKPYNNLPLLPPIIDIESKAVLKECIKARTALAELKQTGHMLPNQNVLINTISLLEAQSSSEIENIVTTQDKLFEFANYDIYKANPATKETIHYRTALYDGIKLLDQCPLCTNTTIYIMQTLRESKEGIRKNPGTTLSNSKTGSVIYTPPYGEDIIREKLANWEKFISSETDIDPLIVMSVMHYQFEAIHPFSDGNGRTGRILNILYLIQENLLEIPVLYLSRHINNTKQEYYSKLINVTTNNKWEEWILYMLNAVYETSIWTKNKIIAIKELINTTKNYIRKELPKIYTMELVEVLFEQPYCRIENFKKANIAKRQTASIYLKELVKIGVLEERKAGKEKLFINNSFLKLLSE